MLVYEYRLMPGSLQWTRCDRETALACLSHRRDRSEELIKRVDEGETVTGITFQLRRYDEANEPIQSRPDMPVEADGDILWAI